MFHGLHQRALPVRTGGAKAARTGEQQQQAAAAASQTLPRPGATLQQQQHRTPRDYAPAGPEQAAAANQDDDDEAAAAVPDDSCWSAQAIWMDGVPDIHQSNQVVKVNLMDYLSERQRPRNQPSSDTRRLYFSPTFGDTSPTTRSQLHDALYQACAVAGFALISKGWEETKHKFRLSCQYGNKTFVKGRHGLCPFKLTIKWDAERQRYFLKAGQGCGQHRFHPPLRDVPDRVARIHGREKPKAKAKAARPQFEKKKNPTVVIDNDLNWKPGGVWITVTREAREGYYDDNGQPQNPLIQVNLMDYLLVGEDPPIAKDPVYFPATYSDTQPETRRQLVQVIVQACHEAGFKISSKGWDNANRIRFICPRNECYKAGPRGLASVVQIPSMKNPPGHRHRERPLCEAERCWFRFLVRWRPKLSRYTLEPGDGFGVHTGHRRDTDPRGPVTAQMRETQHTKAWEGGNALERYLPFFKGACSAADYSLEADKMLRSRLGDLVEDLRGIVQKKYEKEKAHRQSMEAAAASSSENDKNENEKRPAVADPVEALNASDSSSPAAVAESAAKKARYDII